MSDPGTLKPVAFEPLQQPHSARRTLSPRLLLLATVVLFSLLAMLFMLIARPVIFRLDPASATLDVSGMNFSIGDNYLLLPGNHQVEATAQGYYQLQQSIDVEGDNNQFDLLLQPLPGKLQIDSALDNIEVFIDGQPAGTAPGLISNIEPGAHQLELRKKRYFPLQQNIDIEGRDKIQSLAVKLQPAWGQMYFDTRPAAAELYIDEQLIGQTPLQTEVLETGTRVRVSAGGYKNWQREVRVKAGQSETHPLIELEVADGFINLSSQPSGAAITVDGQFRGNTPQQLALSPLQSHRLELLLEGYLKSTRTVSVNAEQHSDLHLELQANIGRVSLSVSPASAEVLVDGKPVGRGSQTLSLPARKHQLQVRAAGYAGKTLHITPRPQQAQSLDVALLTLEQAYWATRPAQITSPVGNNLKLFRPDARRFTLGAARREPGRRANEREITVRLQRPFYLATTETSNAEFRRWREQHSSSAIRGQTLDMDKQPVARVTWEEAVLFCNWLSSQQGLPPFYQISNGSISGFDWQSHGYRLPTEAEWAWAARIDNKGKRLTFPWGSELYPPATASENYADKNAAKLVAFYLNNYDDRYPVAAFVGSFDPNSKGLYDMGGNVAEWVNDFYDLRTERPADEMDPRGPDSGSRHVARGASWALASRTELRLSYREPVDGSRLDLGFRIARYVDSPGVQP